MSAKAAWAELVMSIKVCRKFGHSWGERQWWGDAQHEKGGTHRCVRCGKIGVEGDK